MDMSLEDWEDLFGHKHAVSALLCLHAANGQPQRWTDVSNSMSQRLGYWVDPQPVNRALTALRQRGLVERVGCDDESPRNRRYALTQQGTDLARQVNDMFGRVDG